MPQEKGTNDLDQDDQNQRPLQRCAADKKRIRRNFDSAAVLAGSCSKSAAARNRSRKPYDVPIATNVDIRPGTSGFLYLVSILTAVESTGIESLAKDI